MRQLLLAATLVLAALPARAEIIARIDTWQSEVAAMIADKDSWLEYAPAPRTLDAAMVASGVDWARRYAGDWGGWIFVDWSTARQVYQNAGHDLAAWQRALHAGGFDEAAVEAMLEQGMERLRRIDAQMGPWFRDDIDNAVERALWLDAAHAVEIRTPVGRSAADQALIDRYRARADAAFDDSISPDYNRLPRVRVFAPVPEDGSPVSTDPTLAWREFAEILDTAEQPDPDATLAQAIDILVLHPDPRGAESLDLLRALQARRRFAREPVSDLLDEAERAPPGAGRDALLQSAAAALEERIGHLAPVLAAGANAEGEAAQLDVARRLLTEAQRLGRMWDDAFALGQPPSPYLRSVNGLRAALELLAAPGEVATSARRANQVLTDIAGTMRVPVSPVAPFAPQAGAVAAQIDDVRQAFDQASEALDGVAAAIGGDPRGLERARQAARNLQETLDPVRMVRNMASSFVEGMASNVPFLRGVLDLVTR